MWGSPANSEFDFANAVYDLTQVQNVEALIVDYRYNSGGLIRAPKLGTALSAAHPAATFGMDQRLKPTDHFQMIPIFYNPH